LELRGKRFGRFFTASPENRSLLSAFLNEQHLRLQGWLLHHPGFFGLTGLARRQISVLRFSVFGPFIASVVTL
jgi:hypothetical protein